MAALGLLLCAAGSQGAAAERVRALPARRQLNHNDDFDDDYWDDYYYDDGSSDDEDADESEDESDDEDADESEDESDDEDADESEDESDDDVPYCADEGIYCGVDDDDNYVCDVDFCCGTPWDRDVSDCCVNHCNCDDGGLCDCNGEWCDATGKDRWSGSYEENVIDTWLSFDGIYEGDDETCASRGWTEDGECDEGEFCAYGTDVADCEGEGGNSCQYACDGVCDEDDDCDFGTDNCDCNDGYEHPGADPGTDAPADARADGLPRGGRRRRELVERRPHRRRRGDVRVGRGGRRRLRRGRRRVRAPRAVGRRRHGRRRRGRAAAAPAEAAARVDFTVAFVAADDDEAAALNDGYVDELTDAVASGAFGDALEYDATVDVDASVALIETESTVATTRETRTRPPSAAPTATDADDDSGGASTASLDGAMAYVAVAAAVVLAIAVAATVASGGPEARASSSRTRCRCWGSCRTTGGEPFFVKFAARTAWAGAVAEFFQLASAALFDANLGLFKVGSSENLTYQIADAAADLVMAGAAAWFAFAGKLLGKALLEGHHFANAHLNMVILKHIASEPVALGDLELVDKELFKSLDQLRTMDPELVETLCLTFSIEHISFGAVVTRTSSPAAGTSRSTGRTSALLAAFARASSTSAPGLAGLSGGVFAVAPKELCMLLSARELELALCGHPDIDVADWRRSTVYKGAFAREREAHEVVAWFWETVETWDDDRLALLLHHTCFNRIDIPLFTSKAALAAAFDIALNPENVVGFSMD
ncbi:ubiquitin protein ligase [Aureococcus anophagefferens]|nr:ubiquitin protein ligase [Aureococcus anophagefferens]